jgi:diguanylate cyclase (GGDEF)-like protein
MKTVFVVDDNPTNLISAKETLSETYRTLTILSAEKMFSLAEKIHPDIILLDIEMPETDGFTAIKQIKENVLLKDVPVIFLTSHRDSEIEIKGFDLGAVDFITKPFSAPVLLKRIQSHINTDNIIKETVNSLKIVQTSAFTDNMTGLYNRNGYLAQYRNFCVQDCMPLGIISGDINYLKKINDTFGHTAGDKLLSTVAEIVKKHLPEDAFAARTGGDELVILIPGGGAEKASEFISKISAEFSTINAEIIGEPSVSWGIAEMNSPDENYDEIFEIADKRMYMHKKSLKAERV